MQNKCNGNCFNRHGGNHYMYRPSYGTLGPPPISHDHNYYDQRSSYRSPHYGGGRPGGRFNGPAIGLGLGGLATGLLVGSMFPRPNNSYGPPPPYPYPYPYPPPGNYPYPYPYPPQPYQGVY